LQLDDVVAEPCAQLVSPGAVRQRAGKQPGIVDAGERADLAMLGDGFDRGSIWQEGPDDGPAALIVRAEIVKWIGVATFEDRVSLSGQFGHQASLTGLDRILRISINGTCSHSGRCVSS